jgi:spore maturation protein CgeB
MKQQLNIALFSHSLVSDWNHGNVHFLRGLMQALVQEGHNVRCYEELGSWSLSNLLRERSQVAIDSIDQFTRVFPRLNVRFYDTKNNFAAFLDAELKDADVVLVHEWNAPLVVNRILALKKRFGFVALFHDTHHRAYTRPAEILQFDLHLFDGVLAFGEAIRHIYANAFGVPRTWTFHEAADVEVFQPIEQPKEIDVIWIGNWGDEERTRELQAFLLEPVTQIQGCRTVVYGVRYPRLALQKLQAAGVEYRGYLPNLHSPEVYARSLISVHIPRQQYANGLSGIPTIRVFEAMACGIPLVCSPWSDVEHLFRPGADYLVVAGSAQMKAAIQELMSDENARRQISSNALDTIHRNHTCAHRARQLIAICEEVAG